MFSEDTRAILARILLALAEGERKVEDARKEICHEDSYDIQAIFRVLDNNGDNFITPKDIQKYLNSFGLEVNLIEVKLLILFYDQDHDLTLTYGEIFKIIHPGKEFPRIPKYRPDEELNVRVNRKLYNLLEQEILMARIVLSLLEEIKHKRDFNIHAAFHELKYYACITGDSINLFLRNCGMNPTAGDVRAIVKRLDINKDDIIDFCEFHAFLGFPDCTFCCPCFPCGSCGTKYCEYCLQDIPCYLLGCDHKGMDSKMRCTSPEHTPGGMGKSSILSSLYQTSPKGRFIPRGDEEENEKDDNFSRTKKSNMKGENSNNLNQQGYNTFNSTFYNPNKNAYMRGNISPEQFKLLQGLTNPEQLNKFMTISGILDRQNAGEINLTDNLSLRLSPQRDFDPKEWGCKNCACNIHANPNVKCDCCTCDICPFKHNNSANPERQKLIKFPKLSMYSYSYSYDTDNVGPNNSFISTSNKPNNSLYVNSPKKNNVFFDKETNKYKTMASSDEENEYDDYMKKVINVKNQFDNANKNFPNINENPNNLPNNMISSDEIENNNRMPGQRGYNENNMDENINEDEEEVEIRTKKVIGNKVYENQGDLNNRNRKPNKSVNQKKGLNNNPDEEYGNEADNEEENGNENNFQPNNNQNQNNLQNNGRNNNLGEQYPDNNYPNQNFNNNPQMNNGNLNNNFDNRNMGNNPNQNPPNNYPTSNAGFNNNKIDPLAGITIKTTQLIDGNNNLNNKGGNKKNYVSGMMEEESEEDLSNRNILTKSQEEIVDEKERDFIKYLKAVAKSEKEIEFARRDLFRQPDFNGEDAFRLFEVEGAGVITKKDLIFGLKLLGIKPTNQQIDLIFNKYDLEDNSFMRYSDFFDMVVSYKHEDRKEEERRKSNRRIGNRNITIFAPKTRELFRNLFLVIIDEEQRLELLKQELNMDDYTLKEIFDKINVDKDGLCDKDEFSSYCLKNRICKEKKDAYLIFIRLNKIRDGGLGNNELKGELKSSLSGK